MSEESQGTAKPHGDGESQRRREEVGGRGGKGAEQEAAQQYRETMTFD